MKKAMIPTKYRPTTMISLRIPVDVLEKLRKIAPAKGMSGYQALIKYYVGKGLTEDLGLVKQIESAEKLEATPANLGLKAEQIDRVRAALSGFLQPKSKQIGEHGPESAGKE
jgi:hypothetical protein